MTEPENIFEQKVGVGGFQKPLAGADQRQCFGSGSGWIRVFSPIRILILKTRILNRPFFALDEV